MMAFMSTPIREARILRNLAVVELAEAVGTSASNMSRVERGHHPPPRDLARRIYAFFEGELPIIDILDPTFMDEFGMIKKSRSGWYHVERRDGTESFRGSAEMRRYLGLDRRRR